MAPKTAKKVLKGILENLSGGNLDKFRAELLDRKDGVKMSQVEDKGYLVITDVMISVYTERKALKVAEELLREISCIQDADELVKEAKGAGLYCSADESCSDATKAEEADVPPRPTPDGPVTQTGLAPPVSNVTAFWKSKKDDPGVYPVTEASYRNRVALMITNKEFSDETMNRRGAEKDEENMEKLLSSLGYEVVKHQNLTGKEIDDVLQCFSKHPKLKQTDSVFVIIMSHGEEGKIHGVNWKQNNRDEFLINNIYKRLGPGTCPELINKPKVIIIQACRGGGKGIVMIHSDDLNTANDVSDHETFESDFIHVHKEKDFIALHSSTHATVAYRGPETGSVLIKNIKKVFRPESFQKHLVELFTEVLRKVSEFSHEDKLQMATMERNTLNKSFYLFQGLLDNSH